jgi:type I restriction enzyme S subunit
MGAKPYPAYKDSGVEWIGSIPEHWEVKAFRTLGQFYGGLTGKAGPDFTDEGPNTQFFIPFTNILNNTYINWHELKPVQLDPLEKQNKVVSGDLLFLMSSEDYEFLGWSSVAVNVPRNVYLNSFCKGFHLSANVSPAFINYFNKSIPGRSLIGCVGNGFTRINLRTSALASVKIPSPPLEEQQQIASFLDRETGKIDTLVKQQQQLISLLKEKRQSLISHTVTKGLNPNVRMKDSGVEWIGEIPEHWEVKKLKNHIESKADIFIDGDWIESPYITDSGYRLLQTGNVGIGRFKEQGHRYISEDTFTQLKCTEVLPNDVLICRLADPVGRACMAPDLGVRMVTSVDVAILRLGIINQHRYLTYFFSSGEYLLYMESVCRGGTRDRVSRSFLGSVFLPSPPLEEQKQIAAFLDTETSKIDELVIKANQSIALLKERRSSLISAAVTGKIDVREVA